MEMLCPVCMGPLATAGGQTARCTIHGGEFRIMYSKDESSAEAENPPSPEGGTYKATCPGCGQRYAAGAEHGGTTLECSNCGRSFVVEAPRPARYMAAIPFPLVMPPASLPGLGTSPMCVTHPEVKAVQNCAVCRAPICATCDFSFPGGIHVCPTCASKPQTGVGERRKTTLVWSYVLVVWSSLGLAVLFSGVLAGTVSSKAELEVLGMAIMLLIFIPSIVGTAMAVSSIDRRLANTAVIWVSVVWNAVVLSALLLLTIIGFFQ